jgi:hypothetical protein
MGIFGKKLDGSLNSAELSALWHQYMGDSMAICVYKYFINVVTDKKIKSILEDSLLRSENHTSQITAYLRNSNFQHPIGFTENDVNLEAPRLFSDQCLLFYSKLMTAHGLTAYSLALTNIDRKDLQDYFLECIVSAKELYQRITGLSKTYPNFTTVPAVPPSKKIEFTDTTGMLSNLAGEKRPLNISEISSVFYNSMKTGLVRTLSLAFAQVAEYDDVRKFMAKNAELAGKDADSLDTILRQDYLPVPFKWDAEITDSTVSPFSDKLMMFHAAFLVNTALSYYGAGAGSSLRSDLNVTYQKVSLHAAQAGALCYKILVKHRWLEQQPQSVNRNA